MSTPATEPPRATVPSVPTPSAQGARCLRCGTALAEDQEWCLECGTGRTHLHAAPDWRIPVAVIAMVVALVLAALVVVLIELSIDANRSAGATAATQKVASVARWARPTELQPAPNTELID